MMCIHGEIENPAEGVRPSSRGKPSSSCFSQDDDGALKFFFAIWSISHPSIYLSSSCRFGVSAFHHMLRTWVERCQNVGLGGSSSGFGWSVPIRNLGVLWSSSAYVLKSTKYPIISIYPTLPTRPTLLSFSVLTMHATICTAGREGQDCEFILSVSMQDVSQYIIIQYYTMICLHLSVLLWAPLHAEKMETLRQNEKAADSNWPMA